MSAKRHPLILVEKIEGIGTDPAYVELAHRQFQKTLPVGEKHDDGVHYQVPTDLLSLVLPEGSVGKIEEVVFVYKK